MVILYGAISHTSLWMLSSSSFYQMGAKWLLVLLAFRFNVTQYIEHDLYELSAAQFGEAMKNGMDKSFVVKV
jgi:hypothetical protein